MFECVELLGRGLESGVYTIEQASPDYCACCCCRHFWQLLPRLGLGSLDVGALLYRQFTRISSVVMFGLARFQSTTQ